MTSTDNVRLGPREGSCQTCTAYMYGGCVDQHDPGWPRCAFARTTEYLCKRIWTQKGSKWHCSGYEMLKPNQCHECGGRLDAVAYTKHDENHLGHAVFACSKGHQHFYGIVKIWMRQTREQREDAAQFEPPKREEGSR